MKRSLATLTLIVCLSFPALAGHVMGNGAYCECDNPESHTMNTRSADCGTVQDKNQDSTPDTELGLLLLILTAWLKAKA